MLQVIETQYDYVWILDDDTIPTENALEEFYNFIGDEREFGFLSSYVKWSDGSLCTMNVQRKSLLKKLTSFDQKVIPIQYATFVSFFVSMKVVKEVGAPIGDFFIWGDDWEYSRRISKKYNSYLLMNSVAVHKTLHNQGCDISNDVEERIPRYRLYYRNNFYVAKQEGILGAFYYMLKILKDFIRIIFKSKTLKKQRMDAMKDGILDGIKFCPQIKMHQ